MPKLLEVETVLDNDKTILGFRVRHSVLFGITQKALDGWMVTTDLVRPAWRGNHPNRKEAAEHLKRLKRLETNSLTLVHQSTGALCT